MGNVNSCGFLGGLCGGLWGSQRNSTSIVVEERAPTESRRCRSTKLVLQVGMMYVLISFGAHGGDVHDCKCMWGACRS